MTKEELERIDAIRLRYLRLVYETTNNGLRTSCVSADAIVDELGISRVEVRSVAQFLEGEGLLRYVGTVMVGMTHEGNMEVEAAIRGEATPHFPLETVRVVIMGNVSGSNVQIGTSGGAQSISHVQTNDLEAIREFLAKVDGVLGASNLEQDARAALTADVGSIRAQLDHPRPNRGIVRAALNGVVEVLRRIPVEVTAAFLAHEVGANLPALLAEGHRLVILLGG